MSMLADTKTTTQSRLDAADTQAHVAAVEAAMKARGRIHRAGGSLPELAARIGSRIRYADFICEDGSGARIAFQIGRREARGGLPVLRARVELQT
jgi:hypothetical protein